MANHSSILAWKTPGTEEPGRLQFMGLQRVECNEHARRHRTVNFPTKVILFSLKSINAHPLYSFLSPGRAVKYRTIQTRDQSP